MNYKFGPTIEDRGVTFRLYAPSAKQPEVVLREGKTLAMARAEDGFWTAFAEGAGEGQRYRFRSGGLEFPDLASRQQDGDTKGWSIVRRPLPPSGRREPISPWQEAVFCEVHVGTATPEGTFDALRERLEHFRDAGYTTLELMPVNEFPGNRNWGYDGTLIFAPESAYGTPESLRALVDRAHELRLCIILDVVYNHFGEVDNFVRDYAPEWFADDVETPWGPAINFDDPMVRRFYYENARMWLTEYDLDGLRFDAVHEMKTESVDLFLGELTTAARQAKSHAKLIAENMDNIASWLTRDECERPRDFTAQWNDDTHHVVHFLVTGEKKLGYEDESRDPYADLEKGLRDGFIHDGEADGDGESDGRTGGEPGSELPPDAFVGYVQNHDQIGNRADGKRLADRVSAEKLDFVHFITMLAPHLPLFFMGEEAHLRSGFPFFIDLDEKAAAAKRRDRYKQMEEMFKEKVEEGDLPEPNDPATFESAKLPWDDFNKPERQAALQRFRHLAAWRREFVWPLLMTRYVDAVSARHGQAIVVTWEFEAGWLTLALNPADQGNDLPCAITGMPLATGGYSQNGEMLRLDGWSALAWTVWRR